MNSDDTMSAADWACHTAADAYANAIRVGRPGHRTRLFRAYRAGWFGDPLASLLKPNARKLPDKSVRDAHAAGLAAGRCYRGAPLKAVGTLTDATAAS